MLLEQTCTIAVMPRSTVIAFNCALQNFHGSIVSLSAGDLQAEFAFSRFFLPFFAFLNTKNEVVIFSIDLQCSYEQ